MDDQDRCEDIRKEMKQEARKASDENSPVDVKAVDEEASAQLDRMDRQETTRLWRQIQRGQISRRQFMKLLGFTVFGTVAGLSLPRFLQQEFPQAPTGFASHGGSYNETVNLGEKGLSDGDDITSFLESVQDNTKYIVPEGTYSLSSTSVNADNWAFVSDTCARLDAGRSGSLKLRGTDYKFGGFVFTNGSSDEMAYQLNVSGGNWAIGNVAYTGKRPVDSYNLAPSVSESGMTGIFDNCYWPGVKDGADTGMAWILGSSQSDPKAHRGDLLFKNCNFTRGGVYGTKSAYLLKDGRTLFDNCYFYSGNIHNIRTGTANKTTFVRNCTVHVNKKDVVKRSDGAMSPRGIWVWYGNSNIVDCEIHNTVSGAVLTKKKYGHQGTATMDGGNLKGDTDGNVAVKDNVGRDPDTSIPDGVPTAPEDVCDGASSLDLPKAISGTSSSTGTASESVGENSC